MEKVVRYAYIGEDKNKNGKDVEQQDNSVGFTGEKEHSWQKILCDYVLLNLELSLRYRNVEMKQIVLSYELFRDIQIQVQTEEQGLVDGRASSIPYEAWCDNEDDRDSFKESGYQDVIWLEFCDCCSEEKIESVMRKVCELLEEKLEVGVSLHI